MDPIDKPAPTDAGGHGADPAAGGADANGTQRQYGEKDVLAFLKDTTGKDFANLDEAVKSVKNLNSLVGDQAIVELRKKAGSHETYESIVRGYAKQQGLTLDEARDELHSLKADEPARKKGKNDAEPADESELKKEVSSVRERLDLADLLAAHPESKHVLDDVKKLAKADGVTLQQAFESSAALKEYAKATAAQKDRSAKPTSPGPSGRLAPTGGKAVEDARAAFSSKRNGANAEALVKAALGL